MRAASRSVPARWRQTSTLLSSESASSKFNEAPFTVLAAPWYFLPFDAFKRKNLLFYVGFVRDLAVLYFAAARLGYARSSAKT